MNIQTAETIIKVMEETPLVPVFNHANVEISKKVLDCCYAYGVRVFEFTNRGPNALTTFSELAVHARIYPDLFLGIGTIFTVASAQQFINAGATFIVSPALIPELIQFTKSVNVLHIPGCGSITEVYHAFQQDITLIKAFPGHVLGPGFVKAVKSVIPELLVMPTGGVSLEKDNIKEWRNAGVHCVGIGSHLFNKSFLAKSDYDELGKKIQQTLSYLK